MTIRIYPSRLPGEPLETHEHGAITIHQWLIKKVEGYKPVDWPPESPDNQYHLNK